METLIEHQMHMGIDLFSPEVRRSMEPCDNLLVDVPQAAIYCLARRT